MEFLKFLKWKYKKSSFEDKIWYVGLFLILLGFFNPYLIVLGLGLWFFIVFKFLIVEKYLKDYQEFKEDQNKIFEIIKNSDQK